MKRSLLLLISLITTVAFAANKDASKSTATSSTRNDTQKTLSRPIARIESDYSNQFVSSPTTDTENHNRDGSYTDESVIEHPKIILSIKESEDSVPRLIDTHRLTKKEKIAVRNKLKAIKIPNNIRSRFNFLFSSWEHFINTDSKIIYSSNLGDRKQSKYYSQLLNMGKKILPLVVEKMLDEKYFYAIILYDDLQNNNPQLRCRVGDKTATGTIVDEQTRAARTVLKWYNNASKSK